VAAIALIGLDWGTSSLRAYRIGADGSVIDRRSVAAGIMQIEHGDFEDAFEREVGAWLEAAPDVPVLASGMIASRQGWVEAPYVQCPAGIGELASALLQHKTARGRRIHFVPGLSFLAADGVPDVIRGEETQILGEINDGEEARLMVLPGTHSKWAVAAAGRIEWFATFMTGELFAVLKQHSILGRLMQGDRDDAAAFAKGLAYAGEAGSGLLKRLFSGRTLGLFERLPESGIASYLSGLLIGTEIEEALAWTRARIDPGGVTVIGASGLAERYLSALEAKGLAARRAADDIVARGLFRIARKGGLLP
jgi:2-dehydro-3-deoxygalactonokinase